MVNKTWTEIQIAAWVTMKAYFFYALLTVHLSKNLSN